MYEGKGWFHGLSSCCTEVDPPQELGLLEDYTPLTINDLMRQPARRLVPSRPTSSCSFLTRKANRTPVNTITHEETFSESFCSPKRDVPLPTNPAVEVMNEVMSLTAKLNPLLQGGGCDVLKAKSPAGAEKVVRAGRVEAVPSCTEQMEATLRAGDLDSYHEMAAAQLSHNHHAAYHLSTLAMLRANPTHVNLFSKQVRRAKQRERRHTHGRRKDFVKDNAAEVLLLTKEMLTQNQVASTQVMQRRSVNVRDRKLADDTQRQAQVETKVTRSTKRIERWVEAKRTKEESARVAATRSCGERAQIALKWHVLARLINRSTLFIRLHQRVLEQRQDAIRDEAARRIQRHVWKARIQKLKFEKLTQVVDEIRKRRGALMIHAYRLRHRVAATPTMKDALLLLREDISLRFRVACGHFFSRIRSLQRFILQVGRKRRFQLHVLSLQWCKLEERISRQQRTKEAEKVKAALLRRTSAAAPRGQQPRGVGQPSSQEEDLMSAISKDCQDLKRTIRCPEEYRRRKLFEILMMKRRAHVAALDAYDEAVRRYTHKMEDYDFACCVSQSSQHLIPIPKRDYGHAPLLRLTLTEEDVETHIRKGWKMVEREMAEARLKKSAFVLPMSPAFPPD